MPNNTNINNFYSVATHTQKKQGKGFETRVPELPLNPPSFTSGLLNEIFRVTQYILNHFSKALTLGLAGQVIGSSAMALGSTYNSSATDQNTLSDRINVNPSLNNSLALIEQRVAPILTPRVQNSTEATEKSWHALTDKKFNIKGVKRSKRADAIQKETDINAKDTKGNTLLHLAAKEGNLSAVQSLVRQGADLNAKANDGSTPLHLAAKRGLVPVIQFLIEQGSNVYANDNEGRSPLHWAVTGPDNVDTVQYLIEKGATLKERDKAGGTVLHWAARAGNFNTLKYLIEEQKLSANTSSQWSGQLWRGEFLLHWAVIRSDNVAVLKYLIEEQQLDVNAPPDITLGTPLHVVVQYDHLDTLKYLIEEHKANVNAINLLGATPLHLAAKNNKLDIMKYLIDEQKANINAIGLNCLTPLHLAVSFGQLNAVKLLVEKGANMAAKDSNGKTPLDIAMEKNHLPIVKYLESQVGNLSRDAAESQKPTNQDSRSRRSVQPSTSHFFGETPTIYASIQPTIQPVFKA